MGDRYHNADYIRTHFNSLLLQDMQLPFDYSFNYEDITLENLKNYKILIFFRDGLIFPKGYIGPDAYPYASDLMQNPQPGLFDTWVTEDMGQTIKSWVSNGGNLYAYHNNPNVANYSINYRQVLGGIYNGHPTERPFQIQIKNKTHPITQGVKDFYVTDEQHYPIFDGPDSAILMYGVNTDGLSYENQGTTSIAGWALNYGLGRVVHTAPGHNLNVLWNPDYLTLQKNAIRWLQRQT